MDPPVGTIALLFTDVEGSTRLAGVLGPEWARVIADHHAIVGGAIDAEGGYVDGVEGDAFFATFAAAAPAARAAVAALRGLREHAWPPAVGDELPVRMGLHVGHVERQHTGYVGLEVHRAARVASAAHGGQLLLTGAARMLLGDAVPTEPVGTHRLKDFPAPEPLWTAVVDGRGADAFPPPRAQRLRPTNLPSGVPVLVGRDEDLARVRTAVLDERERLVTLTGRGGAGKTVLALTAAGELLDAHLGGVWLVRLAQLTRADEVLPAIGAAIGASPDEPVADRLREARGPVLLVLDNLEHLPDAGPEVAALLDAVPELHVLATSQAPLRLAAERALPVDALGPEAALELIDRIVARRGGTPPEDRAALREIVELLDGLPLALELAAARLALLPPAALRDRLRESPDVLRAAGAELPERQRSLQATADWTLGLLEDAPRALFDRLGAFAGPVEVAELELVCGGDGLDVLLALDALVDVALVRRVESGDGRVRFGLPEALRQIAVRRLAAAPGADRWRRAHAERQRDVLWAARALSSTPGADYRRAIAAGPEADVALRWATAAGDPTAPALRAVRAGLLSGLGRSTEALALLRPLLDDPPDDPEVHALALGYAGHAMLDTGQLEEAEAAGRRAAEVAPEPLGRALAYVLLGLLATFGGHHAEAIFHNERATAQAREVGTPFLAGTLAMEAQARMYAGELDRAAAVLDEAQRLGAPCDVARLWFRYTFFGDLALLRGDFEGALQEYLVSMQTAEGMDQRLQMLLDMLGAARALARLGRDAAAVEMLGLAEAVSADTGAHALPSVMEPAAREELDAAVARLGAAGALEARALGHAIAPGRRVLHAAQLIGA